VDLSISLSKFKTHEFMYATGSVKNMFGLMPSTKKSAQHLRHPSRGSFAKMICGLMTHAKVGYTIMDAVIGMEGAGPANGTPREVGKIIAGDNPFAVDIAQATIMGYDPMKMPILQCAFENKMANLNSIEDVTYSLIHAKTIIIADYNRIGDNTAQNISGEEKEYLNRPAPEFQEKKCIQCKKCINICPAKALTLEGKKVFINEALCIRCYCCHEVCPVNAISISH
jgi:ferredoxin